MQSSSSLTSIPPSNSIQASSYIPPSTSIPPTICPICNSCPANNCSCPVCNSLKSNPFINDYGLITVGVLGGLLCLFIILFIVK